MKHLLHLYIHIYNVCTLCATTCINTEHLLSSNPEMSNWCVVDLTLLTEHRRLRLDPRAPGDPRAVSPGFDMKTSAD